MISSVDKKAGVSSSCVVCSRRTVETTDPVCYLCRHKPSNVEILPSSSTRRMEELLLENTSVKRCEDCWAEFNTVNDWRFHMIDVHQMKIRTDSSALNEVNPDNRRCKECWVEFTSVNDYIHHMLDVHNVDLQNHYKISSFNKVSKIEDSTLKRTCRNTVVLQNQTKTKLNFCSKCGHSFSEEHQKGQCKGLLHMMQSCVVVLRDIFRHEGRAEKSNHNISETSSVVPYRFRRSYNLRTIEGQCQIPNEVDSFSYYCCDSPNANTKELEKNLATSLCDNCGISFNSLKLLEEHVATSCSTSVKQKFDIETYEFDFQEKEQQMLIKTEPDFVDGDIKTIALAKPIKIEPGSDKEGLQHMMKSCVVVLRDIFRHEGRAEKFNHNLSKKSSVVPYSFKKSPNLHTIEDQCQIQTEADSFLYDCCDSPNANTKELEKNLATSLCDHCGISFNSLKLLEAHLATSCSILVKPKVDIDTYEFDFQEKEKQMLIKSEPDFVDGDIKEDTFEREIKVEPLEPYYIEKQQQTNVLEKLIKIEPGSDKEEMQDSTFEQPLVIALEGIQSEMQEDTFEREIKVEPLDPYYIEKQQQTNVFEKLIKIEPGSDKEEMQDSTFEQPLVIALEGIQSEMQEDTFEREIKVEPLEPYYIEKQQQTNALEKLIKIEPGSDKEEMQDSPFEQPLVIALEGIESEMQTEILQKIIKTEPVYAEENMQESCEPHALDTEQNTNEIQANFLLKSIKTEPVTDEEEEIEILQDLIRTEPDYAEENMQTYFLLRPVKMQPVTNDSEQQDAVANDEHLYHAIDLKNEKIPELFENEEENTDLEPPFKKHRSGDYHVESSFICFLCFKQFYDGNEVYRHILQKHNCSYECNECRRFLPNVEYFIFHMLCHQRCCCMFCGKIIESLCSLHLHTMEHMMQVNPNSEWFQFLKPVLEAVKIQSSSYTCPFCKSQFPHLATLVFHCSVHLKETNFSAVAAEFKSVFSLEVSLPSISEGCISGKPLKKLINLSPVNPKKLKKKYRKKIVSYFMLQCNKCEELFQTEKALTTHNCFASKFICKLCGLSYKSSTEMYNHNLEHSKMGEITVNPENICILCRIGFEEKAILCDHYLEHIKYGEKACPYCNMAFSDLLTAAKHMKKHIVCGCVLRHCIQCKRMFFNEKNFYQHSCLNLVQDICGKELRCKAAKNANGSFINISFAYKKITPNNIIARRNIDALEKSIIGLKRKSKHKTSSGNMKLTSSILEIQAKKRMILPAISQDQISGNSIQIGPGEGVLITGAAFPNLIGTPAVAGKYQIILATSDTKRSAENKASCSEFPTDPKPSSTFLSPPTEPDIQNETLKPEIVTVESLSHQSTIDKTNQDIVGSSTKFTSTNALEKPVKIEAGSDKEKVQDIFSKEDQLNKAVDLKNEKSLMLSQNEEENTDLDSPLKKQCKDDNPVEPSFICFLCYRVFHDGNEVYRHILDKHNGFFTCNACHQFLPCVEYFIFHTLCHHRSCCMFCGKIFESLRPLRLHVMEHMMQVNPNSDLCQFLKPVLEAVDIQSSSYTCPFCKTQFPHLTRLVHHCSVHLRETKFSAMVPEFKSVFNLEASLPSPSEDCSSEEPLIKIINLNPFHPKRTKFQEKIVSFSLCKCNKCEELFQTEKALTAHKCFAAKFTCKLCGLSYKSSTEMHNHNLDHSKMGEMIVHPENICNLCQIGFEKKIILFDHYLEHVKYGEKACPYCNLAFSDLLMAAKHMKKHIELIYRHILRRCIRCERIFFSEMNFYQHLCLDPAEHIYMKDVHCKTVKKSLKCTTCGSFVNTNLIPKKLTPNNREVRRNINTSMERSSTDLKNPSKQDRTMKLTPSITVRQSFNKKRKLLPAISPGQVSGNLIQNSLFSGTAFPNLTGANCIDGQSQATFANSNTECSAEDSASSIAICTDAMPSSTFLSPFTKPDVEEEKLLPKIVKVESLSQQAAINISHEDIGAVSVQFMPDISDDNQLYKSVDLNKEKKL